MKLTLHHLSLPLLHPFTISRGTITSQPSLVVELEHEGERGWGEATENSYYGHTLQSMSDSLERASKLLSRYVVESPENVWDDALAMMEGDRFALSALDIAAHDLWGKLCKVPTWKNWGLEWRNIPDSSFTIGIDSVEQMLKKIGEQPGWSIYKIKLGTDKDLEIVRQLRRVTTARFRVDANCGWTVEQALEMADALAELDVEFIEQPLPPDARVEDQVRLFENSRLPIIADESCQIERDVAACQGRFHGVNVKICKCGGLTPALRMLREARSLGMKTMVGCMVESSIGISGAAQLLPLLDYADLDGAVLLAEDPAAGVVVQRGKVIPTGGNGTGARLSRG